MDNLLANENGGIYQDAAELHIVEIVQQFEHLVRP